MMRFPGRPFAMVVGLVLLSSGALAADAKKAEKPAPPPPTQEQRATMAEIHRKMADCLASDRPIDECRAEMRASCTQTGMQPGMMGDAGCGMMGGAGMMSGGGMMGGPMMRGTPPPAPKK